MLLLPITVKPPLISPKNELTLYIIGKTPFILLLLITHY